MIPSVSLEAERELIDGAQFYAQEANAELGLAFIAEFERSYWRPLQLPASRPCLARRRAPITSPALPVQHHLSTQARRDSDHCARPSEPPARLLARPQVVAPRGVRQS